jgi:hypothetical protein
MTTMRIERLCKGGRAMSHRMVTRSLILGLLCAQLAGSVGVARGDPVNGSLTEVVQDLRCDFGEGFELVTAVVVDGADVGHALDSTSVGVLHVIAIRTYVDGQLIDEVGYTHPGQGLRLVPCTWTVARYVDEEGRQVDILGEGSALVTPLGA